MQIKTSEHYKQAWLVHDLLADFEVEDVWQFPVKLDEKHTIPIFQNQLFAAMEKLSQKGIPGLLFKFRFFLGELFGWDKEIDSSVKTLKKGSIRERYANKYHLELKDLIPIGNAEFKPVYEKADESLAEISNATVHAGLHLSKVQNGANYNVQMAVYVKPKGTLGKFYMALIKPFRLAFVYPAMMRLVGKHWESYLEGERQLA